MSISYRVAILGSTGYVGIELVKILSKHPKVKINFLGTESKNNQNINHINDKIIDDNLPLLELNINFDPLNFDCVFLALPHGISSKYVKNFYGKIKIIDLSADFRMDTAIKYQKDYGNNHLCLDLLNEFIYGIPEINKEKIINHSNIAIPGCYPTSILLPLIPVLKNNLIDENIIIDSKSGYSGAGKGFNIKNITNSDNNNFYNYNTFNHRHIAEITQELDKVSKFPVNISFNPHILPVFRGMMSSIYCNLKKGKTIEDLEEVLSLFSSESHFIRLLNKNDRSDFYLIQNNNYCYIKVYHDPKKSQILIVSLIDNLIKGAAGQATQCFNISFNLNETLGLENI